MKIHSKHYDVIVIGGGASGMMAAGTAAKNGALVLLIEKNADLGEKLKITGGGRCNITNYELDNRKLLSHYGDAADFLYSPFSEFSVKETFTFFEKRKLPLIVQAGKRAFPKSEKAHDVYKVLKDFLKQGGVDILLKDPVKDIQIKGNTISAIDTQRTRYTADSVIIATGGVAYPETGSTGDGFVWMEKIGHSVHHPSPDIVPVKCSDYWLKKASGAELLFMKISFISEGKKIFSKTGKVLFTHFGLSSPLILNSSQKIGTLLKKGPVQASIDMFPETNLGNLDKKILNLFDQHKNKNIENVLGELIPKKLAAVVIDLARLENPHIKVHSLPLAERKIILNLLKAFPMEITGLMGLDRAVIADGGIPLEEVDTKYMRSKKFKNLYLTGDMLHVNRPSGGYSLQLCWTTGYIAGKNAASK